MDEEQPLSQRDNFWNQTQGVLVKGQLTACLEGGNTRPPLWAAIHSRRRWWAERCLCEAEMHEGCCLWPPCRWPMALSCVLMTQLWLSRWWVSLACTFVAGLVLFFLWESSKENLFHFNADKTEARGGETAPKSSKASGPMVPRWLHHTVLLLRSLFHSQWEDV